MPDIVAANFHILLAFTTIGALIVGFAVGFVVCGVLIAGGKSKEADDA